MQNLSVFLKLNAVTKSTKFYSRHLLLSNKVVDIRELFLEFKRVKKILNIILFTINIIYTNIE